MINQYELDKLMQSIQAGTDTYIYYVASVSELREAKLDEHQYKSNNKFVVVKYKFNSATNALFEYQTYLNDPSKYHMETDDCFYDVNTEYIHYYTVPNYKTSYSKPFNRNYPSIIYGYREQVFVNGEQTRDHTNPSMVKEVYTNKLEYGDYTEAQARNALNKLKWKYKTLNPKVIVDGIEYTYLTSDWYILDIENFPKMELALINTNEKNAFFTNLSDAFEYIDQLNA